MSAGAYPYACMWVPIRATQEVEALLPEPDVCKPVAGTMPIVFSLRFGRGRRRIRYGECWVLGEVTGRLA